MSKSKFWCDSCDREAVGLIKVADETLYLCRYHYEQGLVDYSGAIEDNRLLPA